MPPMHSSYALFQNMFEIVAVFLPDFSPLMKGKCQSTEGTAQGYPIAMIIYSITIILLIFMTNDITLQDYLSTKTAAYADDFTAAANIAQLKNSQINYANLVSNLATILRVKNSGLISNKMTSMQ